MMGLFTYQPFEIGDISGVNLGVRWAFVASTPYIANCLMILIKRLNEGAHDPLAGAESIALRIHAKAMQNTLEQLVWFVLSLIPLATVLHAQELHLIPILSSTFVCGRVLYWWGYFRDGTLGRRYGVQVTLTINIGITLLTAGLLLIRG